MPLQNIGNPLGVDETPNGICAADIIVHFIQGPVARTRAQRNLRLLDLTLRQSRF